TSQSRARRFGPKADSEPVSAAYERLRATGDDKAVAVFTLVVEALIQSDLQFVPPHLSDDAGVLLVEHEANYRALALVLKNECSQLPQDRIALAEGGIGGTLDRVDAERRGAYGVMLSDRVEDVAWAYLVTPHLWNEERVATSRVLLAPLLKIAKIDVWAQQIDM